MTKNTFNKQEKKIIYYTCTGHFLAHATILIFPSIVTPLSTEFKLPFSEIIKISFPMYLIYGLGAFPSGLITDNLKPKTSFFIYFGGLFIFSILASFSKTMIQLKISLAILGIFLSMYHPLGLGIISTNVKKLGSALGINGIFGSIGLALAPFIAGIINYFFGWRMVYRFISILPAVLLIQLLITGINATSNKKINKEFPLKHKDQRARSKAFVILMISMMLSGFVYRGQNIVLPTYFEKKVTFLYNFIVNLENVGKNLSGTKTLSATILTSIVYIISILGQMIGGKIADRYDLRYSYLWFFALSLPFLFSMYYFENFLLFISAIFFILFTIGMQPIENSLVAKYTPQRWRNTSYGLKFIVTFGVGAVVIYPVSYIQKYYSLRNVFILFSLVILLLIANNILLIFYTGRKKIK